VTGNLRHPAPGRAHGDEVSRSPRQGRLMLTEGRKAGDRATSRRAGQGRTTLVPSAAARRNGV